MIDNPFDGNGEITRNQIEYRLQVAVVKHLNTAFPGLLWTHVPNRPANAQDGFFRKAMGVKPGVADLIFWFRDEWDCRGVNGQFIKYFPQAGAIELKTSKGRSSNDQNRFRSSFVHLGGRYAVCKSVQEVHDALVSWGLKPVHNAVAEPDTRSDMQKKHDAFEWMKP